MAAAVADVDGGAPVNRTMEDVIGPGSDNGADGQDQSSPNGGAYFDDSDLNAPRPEQTFFNDPAHDRMMGVVWALATEVYVLRDRLQCLEETLEGAGILNRAALDAEASPEELQAKASDRDAFVAHFMDNLAGIQSAKGPLR